MKTFNELNLSAPLLRAINELGYETPSPIQAETLPILLGDATDFIGLAATGTGKTAAFSIPLLERIDAKKRRVQALVLCPTRELALQVSGQIELLGKFKGIRAVTVYGGASYLDQIAGLRSGAQVVVGTPGRVIDHLERETLQLGDLQVLVLDEADEMFSMGFKEDIELILQKSPRESSQIWLFSATMEREVRRVVEEYLREPKQVAVNRKEMLSSTVEQLYYPTRESDKPEILCKLIEGADDFYGVVFCQTKSLVQDLTSYLVDRGYKVDCLHGDKDQNSRERTMQAFRDRKITILVCTDVAARGLDVKDITHVVNYSLPRELDNYVHRIGRTARSGKAGIAMNLVTLSHRNLMFRIEQMTKTRMKEGVIPSRREIASKKIGKLLESFREQPFYSRAVDVMGSDWKDLLATMNSEQVAAHFLTMMMPELFVDRSRPQRVNSTASFANTDSKTSSGGAPKTMDNTKPSNRPSAENHRARKPEIREATKSAKSPFSKESFREESSPRESFQTRERFNNRKEFNKRTETTLPKRNKTAGGFRKDRNQSHFNDEHPDGHPQKMRSRPADRPAKPSSPVSRKLAAATKAATKPVTKTATRNATRAASNAASNNGSKKERWPANESLIAPNRRARRAALFGNQTSK